MCLPFFSCSGSHALASIYLWFIRIYGWEVRETLGWGRYEGGVWRRQRSRGWTRASVYIFCCVCLFWLTFCDFIELPMTEVFMQQSSSYSTSTLLLTIYALDITSYYVFYHFCQWLCDGNWMELIYRHRRTTLSLLWMNRDSKREREKKSEMRGRRVVVK